MENKKKQKEEIESEIYEIEKNKKEYAQKRINNINKHLKKIESKNPDIFYNYDYLINQRKNKENISMYEHLLNLRKEYEKEPKKGGIVDSRLYRLNQYSKQINEIDEINTTKKKIK